MQSFIKSGGVMRNKSVVNDKYSYLIFLINTRVRSRKFPGAHLTKNLIIKNNL